MVWWWARCYISAPLRQCQKKKSIFREEPTEADGPRNNVTSLAERELRTGPHYQRTLATLRVTGPAHCSSFLLAFRVFSFCPSLLRQPRTALSRDESIYFYGAYDARIHNVRCSSLIRLRRACGVCIILSDESTHCFAFCQEFNMMCVDLSSSFSFIFSESSLRCVAVHRFVTRLRLRSTVLCSEL